MLIASVIQSGTKVTCISLAVFLIILAMPKIITLIKALGKAAEYIAICHKRKRLSRRLKAIERKMDRIMSAEKGQN